MSLKTVLNLSISLSMALSPYAAYATSSLSQDPVELLIQALKTDNAEEAQRLINKARAKAKNEELPPEHLERMNVLLDRATNRLKQTKATNQDQDREQEKGSGPTRPGAARSSNFAGAAPINVIEAGADELTRLLNENPDLRAGMFEIGQGRLTRDASQIDKIVASKNNGRLPREFDADQRRLLELQDQFGGMVATLEKYNVIPSAEKIALENALLREKHPDTDIDKLADILISEAMVSSFVTGMLLRIAQNSDLKAAEFLGTLGEAGVAIAINAEMVLRLANLYDLRLSPYERNVLLMSTWIIARAGLFYGVTKVVRGSKIANFVETFGGKFGQIRAATEANPTLRASKLGNLFRFMMNAPAVAPIAKSLGNLVPDANPPAAPVPPTAGPASPGDNSVDADNKTQTDNKASGSEPGEVHRSARARSWHLGLSIFKTLAKGGWTAFETHMFGWMLKSALNEARRTERALQNESFRLFMLGEDGEAFLKLLILSMNNGNTETDPTKLKNMDDAKIRFVLNLARSARMCSKEDRENFERAQKEPGTTATLSPTQLRILKYACESQLSQARLKRIYAELQTFNEIPQESLPELRIAKHQYRLRMGELLMQMQFLDGDRDPKEKRHFDMIASKYLGLEDPIEKNYFKRLHSFIVDADGMRPEESSPTGFTIATRPGLTNPYDMSIGYMKTSGPDVPASFKSQPTTPLPNQVPSVVRPVPAAIPPSSTIPDFGLPVTR